MKIALFLLTLTLLKKYDEDKTDMINSPDICLPQTVTSITVLRDAHLYLWWWGRWVGWVAFWVCGGWGVGERESQRIY